MQPDKYRDWRQSSISTASMSSPSAPLQRSYSHSSFFVSRAFLAASGASIAVIGICLILFLRQIDVAHKPFPDSSAGLILAVTATIFFILAAVVYYLKKRILRKKTVGGLNAFLQWHMYFSIIAIVTAAMHSFGHFQLVSGSFAFLSLILLVLSGLAGRYLDYMLPRLIVKEITRTTTEQGEDVIAVVSQQVFWQKQQPTLNALRSLLQGNAVATQRVQNYRLLIRYWRVIHIRLCILTAIIICWHILAVTPALLASRR